MDDGGGERLRHKVHQSDDVAWWCWIRRRLLALRRRRQLNQPIQALHYLDRAEKMDPSNYITHNLLGQAYKATGQLAEANREFKTVVDIQRQNDPKPAGK